MLPRHDKYPISCARVHDAMGADGLSLRVSAARFAHQNEQWTVVQFPAFDAGSRRPAVRGEVGPSNVVPFAGFLAHPGSARQSAGGASIGRHSSSPEGVAHRLNEPFGLRFLGRHLAQQFERRDRGRQQNDNVAPLAWINALVGWARRGERRHLVAVAGPALLLGLTATLAMGV